MATTTLKAEVTLTPEGPITFRGNGREFTRGQKIVVTKAADILYYQRQHGFSVRVTGGSMPKVMRGGRGASEPEESDDDLPKPRGKAKVSVQTEPASDDAAEGDLTEEELMTQTKGSLLELIETEDLKIDVSPTMTKAEIVRSIMTAVSKKKK